MFIKQISVYLENVRGSLCEMTECLGQHQINLLAIAIADTSGFGIIRFIVKDDAVDDALAALRGGGYIAQVNDVICISMAHQPNGLAAVLRLIEDNGISIEYAYSFCRSTLTDAVVIIRPSDKHLCEQVLEQAGITMVSQREVDAF
ncbi:MAG: acetolactate synthase [Bacillota bacterium]|nr:acetolactate synthase [Bacillota bacterium]